MTGKTRTRPALERLDDRRCPAVLAAVLDGDLIISGDATVPGDTILVRQTAADTFQVLDGATEVGTFAGVTRDVRFALGAADDRVVLDLGGNTTPRDVEADLGGGDNALTVTGGTVGGQLLVRSLDGTDVVTLGDGSAALGVTGQAVVNLGGGSGDVLDVGSGVTVGGDLLVIDANDVDLAGGSTFGRDVRIISGDEDADDAPLTAAVAGAVARDLGFVGGDLADTFSFTGTVGRNLQVATGGGDDTVTLGGDVAGRLTLASGDGDDTLTITGRVGGMATVAAGDGDDTLTITGTAGFVGRATFNLGDGDDAVTLDDGAAVGPAVFTGGDGTDTFAGRRTAPGRRVVGFEA